MEQIIHLSPSSRWEVLFSDADCWRVGVYRPEFKRPDDIHELEKHTCPELFVFMSGSWTRHTQRPGGTRNLFHAR